MTTELELRKIKRTVRSSEITAAQQGSLAVMAQDTQDARLRETSLNLLIGSMENFLHLLTNELYKSDGSVSRDEVFAVVSEAAYKGVLSWSPEGGADVLTHVRNTAQYTVKGSKDLNTGLIKINERGSRKVKRAIRELVDSGQLTLASHTTESLQAHLRDHFTSKASENITIQNPDLDAFTVTERAHDRLSRDGVMRAINCVGDILALCDGILSFNMPVGEDTTMQDLVAEEKTFSSSSEITLTQVVDFLLEGLPKQHQEVIRARYENNTVTPFTKISVSHGIPVTEVKEIVRSAMARISSPSLQFAHLAVQAEAQFTSYVATAESPTLPTAELLAA